MQQNLIVKCECVDGYGWGWGGGGSSPINETGPCRKSLGTSAVHQEALTCHDDHHRWRPGGSVLCSEESGWSSDSSASLSDLGSASLTKHGDHSVVHTAALWPPVSALMTSAGVLGNSPCSERHRKSDQSSDTVVGDKCFVHLHLGLEGVLSTVLVCVHSHTHVQLLIPQGLGLFTRPEQRCLPMFWSNLFY